MKVNTALLGKRVYKGAGQAPNRGQVSGKGAQGYLQRELRKKQTFNASRLGRPNRPMGNPRGSDGQSDNRSGIAAQALNRRLGGRPIVGNGGRPAPVGTPPIGGGFGRRPPPGMPMPTDGAGGRRPPPVGVPITDGAGGIKNGDSPYKGPGNGPNSGFDPNGPAVPGQPQQNSQPQVTVNDEGLLVLPYNQQYAEEQYSALEEANSELLGLNSEAAQQQLAYGQSKRETDQAYEQTKRGTLNQNAAGGTAFSSKYGTAVANNAGQYSNTMSQLDAENAAFSQDQAFRRAAIQDALNRQLGQSTQQYGGELAEEAGSLGFGNAGQGQGNRGIEQGRRRRREERRDRRQDQRNDNKGKGSKGDKGGKKGENKKKRRPPPKNAPSTDGRQSKNPGKKSSGTPNNLGGRTDATKNRRNVAAKALRRSLSKRKGKK